VGWQTTDGCVLVITAVYRGSFLENKYDEIEIE